MLTRAKFLLAGLMALTGAIGAAQAQDAALVQDEPLTEVRRASQILGAQVAAQGGEQIGDVDDWMIDEEGRSKYIIVGAGGVAGVAEDWVAVPASAAQLVRTDDGTRIIRVKATQEKFEGAPRVGDNYTQLRDADWREKNDAYFSVEGATGDALLISTRELLDAPVRNAQGEEIADLHDLIFDQDFRATYGILGAGGVLGIGESRVPVPFQGLGINYNQNDDAYVLTLSMTQEQLESAPRIEGGNFDSLASPEFRDRIDSYFGGGEAPE